MNDYFNYMDIDEYTPAYPNDAMYKKVIQKNVFPSNFQNMGIDPNNTMNIPMNQQINPNMMQDQNCGLYDAGEGFVKGNMFPNLYDPFGKIQPRVIIAGDERSKELLEIQKIGFAMKDINLYLDVHPEDTCMINLYNRYSNQKKEMLKRFQNKFGPIETTSESLNEVPWAWNQTKWPWEGGK